MSNPVRGIHSGKALMLSQDPPGRKGANQSSHRIDKTIKAITDEMATTWVNLMDAGGTESNSVGFVGRGEVVWVKILMD